MRMMGSATHYKMMAFRKDHRLQLTGWDLDFHLVHCKLTSSGCPHMPCMISQIGSWETKLQLSKEMVYRLSTRAPDTRKRDSVKQASKQLSLKESKIDLAQRLVAAELAQAMQKREIISTRVSSEMSEKQRNLSRDTVCRGSCWLGC